MEEEVSYKPGPKMYAGIVSAFLGSLIITNATELGSLGVGLATASIAGIAVYLVPNPKA